jgi:predicted nucleic acid-binding protein
LLDTNIVIGLSKGPGPASDLVYEQNASPELCAVSQITRIELLSYWALEADEEA